MKKINIAELLKDCPKGMELDCTMFYNVKFDHVDASGDYPIAVTIGEERNYNYLTEYGEWSGNDMAKCVIYPKGKTTWEGFTPPYEFKNGDVIVKNNFIAIISHIEPNGRIWYHCWYNIKYEECKIKTDFGIGCINDDDEIHFATKEEKEKLFKVIEDNGYKWNDESKTLEKLIERRFKVGDIVRLKSKPNYIYTVYSLTWDDNKKLAYELLPKNDKHLRLVSLNAQDDFELVPNKFDITTLKPFDKVLVKDNVTKRWLPNLFACLRSDDDYPYMVIGGVYWRCCIPYEGNEHLLGKADDCDEYYKTWE